MNPFYDNQKLRFVILDHDKKLFGCLISKAGSVSWLRYLIQNKLPTHKRSGWHERNNYFLKPLGLEAVFEMPVSDIRNNYKNWTKYIVVRHPLQRLVSGYFEAIVKRREYPKPDKSIMSFLELSRRVASGELLDKNTHWMRYTRRCQICDVRYDYIVKQETINYDKTRFEHLYGFNGSIPLQKWHPNRQFDVSADQQIHKYDPILRSLQRRHPRAMNGLLKIYKYDMDSFGYHWNSTTGQSYCSADTVDGASNCCWHYNIGNRLIKYIMCFYVIFSVQTSTVWQIRTHSRSDEWLERIELYYLLIIFYLFLNKFLKFNFAPNHI